MKPSNSCEVSICFVRGLSGLNGAGGLKHAGGSRLWFVNAGRLVLSNRRYGNLMLARELCASFLFQQEGFAGLKGERGNSRRGAGLKRLRAEAGNVKTQVVLFLGDFNGNGAAAWPGQRAATGEAWIGAFKGLNGQHGALFDQD